MGSDSFVFIIFSSVLVVSDLCNPIMLDTNQSRAQSKKGLPVSSNKNDFLSNYVLSQISFGELQAFHRTFSLRVFSE